MSEREPKLVGPRNETHLNRVQKLSYYVNLIAEDHGLDTLTYEALSKFAITNLRIREITTDFRGTTYDDVRYPVYEDRDGKIHKLKVTRSFYQDYLNILSTIAFNLHTTYLSKSPASRTAAREIQVLINDEYPIEM